MVVPVYVVLQKKLQKLLKRDIPDSPDSPDSPGGPDSPDVPASKYIETDFTVDAAEAALMKLDKYYNISSELCTIATVLDPRLKLDFYKADQTPSAENPQEIRSYVKFFYEKYYSTPLELRKPSPKKSDLFTEIYGSSRTSRAKSEIDVYLDEPVVQIHDYFTILDYWRINSDRFPQLSRMARDYLAVPGTSTPSERAFSGGRQLITDFRCSLSGDTITACMLLKNWLRQWEDVIQPQLNDSNDFTP